MPTSKATLDTTQYVRINSGIGAFILQAHRDTVRVAFSVAKPVVDNTAFHQLKGDDEPLVVPFTEDNIWALAMTDRSSLTVTEQRFPAEITDRNGFGLAVFVQDQTTEMLDLDFLQELKTGLSLAVDSVATSRDIILTAGHGMVTGTFPAGDVGTMLEIGSTLTGRFIQAKVLAVVGDVITLNQLVGDIFPAGSSVNTGNRNLALVDGSTTPAVFRVEPSPVQAGDITRIIIAIIGPSAMDFSTFGSDPALPVGLLFRVRRPDGSYKNLRTIDVNLEAYLWGFDNSILTPKTGNTSHGLAFRVTFAGQEKHGVTARLDGTLLEQLECVVLDNLNAGTNTTIRVMAEGSELQE